MGGLSEENVYAEGPLPEGKVELKERKEREFAEALGGGIFFKQGKKS